MMRCEVGEGGLLDGELSGRIVTVAQRVSKSS